MEQTTWIPSDTVRNRFSIPITTTTMQPDVQGMNPSVLGSGDTSGAAKPWPEHLKGQGVHPLPEQICHLDTSLSKQGVKTSLDLPLCVLSSLLFYWRG